MAALHEFIWTLLSSLSQSDSRVRHFLASLLKPCLLKQIRADARLHSPFKATGQTRTDLLRSFISRKALLMCMWLKVCVPLLPVSSSESAVQVGHGEAGMPTKLEDVQTSGDGRRSPSYCLDS